MLEWSDGRLFCNVCSHDSLDPRKDGSRAAPAARFTSVDELVARTGLRRDELVTLADIGALNAFGYDRRSALWQAERCDTPVGRAVRRVDADVHLFVEDSQRDLSSVRSASIVSRRRVR